MYRHGMFTKKTFKSGRKHGKGIAPAVLGLGAAAAVGGAGALGWWFWDDIKKTVTDLASSFTLSKADEEVKGPLIETTEVRLPVAVRSSAVQVPSPHDPSPPTSEILDSGGPSSERISVVISGSGPSSYVESTGSSYSNWYPPVEPLVIKKLSDPQNLPDPISEPFDFPFAEFPELGDDDEILPVQPYRNPNRITPATAEDSQLPTQPELVPDLEEEEASEYPKSPFSDPKVFQEGLKALNSYEPPAPERSETPQASMKVHMSEPSVDSELFEPISPVGEYETDYIPHFPDSSISRAPFGTIDKTHLPPLDDIVSRLETPAASEKPPPSIIVDVPIDGSVRDSISRIESQNNSPDTSRRTSRIFESSPFDSKRSSFSEFGLTKPLTAKERKFLKPLSEIQQDLIDHGIPKREWTTGLSIRKIRPISNSRDIGERRHGRVVSVEEKELLDKMIMEHMREEHKEESISNAGSIQKTSNADGEQKPEVILFGNFANCQEPVQPEPAVVPETMQSVTYFSRNSNM
jgi:hypothetical protein